MLATAVLAPLLLLTGCEALTDAGPCVDYAERAAPQEMFDTNALVVLARLEPIDRTVEADGRFPVYSADVLEVLKGELAETPIDVIAPSGGCTERGQPNYDDPGGPLATEDRLVLYLSTTGGGDHFELVHPQGFEVVREGEPLPFDQ